MRERSNGGRTPWYRLYYRARRFGMEETVEDECSRSGRKRRFNVTATLIAKLDQLNL